MSGKTKLRACQAFKDKFKTWHFRSIKKDYKVGDQVLLLNSHFKFSLCKLVSKWEGTMVIKDVYIPEPFYSIV
jgi:hypothetical protein